MLVLLNSQLKKQAFIIRTPNARSWHKVFKVVIQNRDTLYSKGIMGHTLYGSPYGFSQDRGSDISHACFYGWIARSVLVVRAELRRKRMSLHASFFHSKKLS